MYDIDTTALAMPGLLVEIKGYGIKAYMARLFQTAEDFGKKGRDTTYGFGRVNAERALHAKPRLF